MSHSLTAADEHHAVSSVGRVFSLAILFVGVVLASVSLFAAPAAADAPTCSSVTYDGTGTAADPYEVDTVDQLQCIGENHADASSQSDALSSDYELTSDIDASGTSSWNSGDGFDPIGDASSEFTGTFDGDGHTITGLDISRTLTSPVGLFADVESGAEVVNLSLESASVRGDAPVGALAGSNTGTVRQVSVAGSVSGSDNVGGVVGSNFGTVERSYSTASISSITLVVRKGQEGVPRIGGIAGYNAGTIDEVYAAGSVENTDDSGGLVGSERSDGSITNSYWDADATGQSTSAGSPDSRGLSTSEMQGLVARTNLADFQFDGVWATRPSDYPAFEFAANDAPVVEANAGVTVEEGSTANQIANTDLAASDDDPGDTVTYTVTDTADYGTLFVDGTGSGTDDGTLDGESALGSGDTFTQANVDAGNLLYSHDGSETTSDGFDIEVSDGSRTLPAVTFSISVTPVDDAPTLETNAGLTLEEGARSQVGSGVLAASDPEQSAGSLTYSVTDGVAHGTLFVDGTGSGTDDGTLDGESGIGTGTFTQADIDAGNLLYAHDDSDTTSDAFAFTVSDGNGGSTSSATFAISVTPVDDALESNPCDPDTDAPTAIASASSETAEAGESVDFDASNSRDRCEIVSYEWDFDDDGTYEGSGRYPTHAFEIGGEQTVRLRITDEGDNTDTDTVTVSVEGDEATLETNTDTDGDGRTDEIYVQRAPGQEISGTTNVAPGTELSLTITGTDAGAPFVKPLTAVVQPNGSFIAVADFGDNAAGANFSVQVRREGESLLAGGEPVGGRLTQAPTASVSFEDQESFGRQVTVASATFSDGGFLAIHLDDASGEIVGTSDYIEAGSETDVRVTLDQPLDEDATLVAMPHQDTDGDQTFEFQFGSPIDEPYTEGGDAVTAAASITVSDPVETTSDDTETDVETDAVETDVETDAVETDVETDAGETDVETDMETDGMDMETDVETDMETDAGVVATATETADNIVETVIGTTTTSGPGFTITFALFVIAMMAILSARRDLED